MPARLSLFAVSIVSFLFLAGCSPSPQASSPLGGTALQGPKVHVVCPTRTMAADCAFSGGSGIQAAVDAASDGDIVQIRAGTYSPAAVRDVPYKIHTIRGFVVVDGKRLSLVGEPGVVLDGSMGPRTTGLVLHRSTVEVRGLKLSGFRLQRTPSF